MCKPGSRPVSYPWTEPAGNQDPVDQHSVTTSPASKLEQLQSFEISYLHLVSCDSERGKTLAMPRATRPIGGCRGEFQARRTIKGDLLAEAPPEAENPFETFSESAEEPVLE